MRWTITSGLPDDVRFTVNPLSGGSFSVGQNVNDDHTTTGVIRVTIGAPTIGATSIGGTVLDQAQYDMLNGWYTDVVNQVLLTDDLGQATWCWLTDLEFTPKPGHHHPYRHTYTAKLSKVDVS